MSYTYKLLHNYPFEFRLDLSIIFETSFINKFSGFYLKKVSLPQDYNPQWEVHKF